MRRTAMLTNRQSNSRIQIFLNFWANGKRRMVHGSIPCRKMRINRETVSTRRSRMKNHNLLRTLVLAGLLSAILVAPVWADNEGVPWNSLSRQEQQTLKRFHERWDQLPLERQHRLQKGAERWSKMTPEQRQRVRKKFQRWKKLPPEQRQATRERFRKFRQLPPEQRRRIIQRRQWFKSLPPERRQQLKQRWQRMTPEQRQHVRKRFRNVSPEQRSHMRQRWQNRHDRPGQSQRRDIRQRPSHRDR